jgi:hypothetical protein
MRTALKSIKPTESLRKFSTSLISLLIVQAFAIFFISLYPSTPFDEITHFDYAYKIAEGNIPAVNDRYGQKTLEIVACSPIRNSPAWSNLDPCGSSFYEYQKAPFNGLSSATPLNPLYYSITAIPFKVCDQIHNKKNSELTCMRLANSTWLSSATFIITYSLMNFGIGSLWALILSLTLTLTDVNLLQGITVNSDSAAFWFASFMFAMLSSKRLKIKKQYIITTACIGVLLKPTTIPVIFLCAILLNLKNYTQSLNPITKRKNLIDFTKLLSINHILCAAIGITIAMFITWLQAQLRGSWGANEMGIALNTPLKLVFGIMVQSIQAGIFPTSQHTWPANISGYAYYGGILLALAPLLLISNLNFKKSDGFSENEKINGVFFTLFYSTILLSAPLITLMSWIVTGSAFYQPRYFLNLNLFLILVSIAYARNRILVKAVMIPISFCAMANLVMIFKFY